MRICLLTHGNNRFARHYARQFREQGHEILGVSLSPYSLEVPGVETFTIAPPGFDPLDASSSRLGYARCILPLRKLIRRSGVDVVFALYLTSAGVVACLAGHPRIVLSARGSDVNDQIDSRTWRAVFRWQARRAVLVHSVGHHLADLLHERAGVSRDKLFVCAVGIDTGLFSYIEPAVRPNQARIITTRDHFPEHDQVTLVRALAELRARSIPVHLTFASEARAETTRSHVAEYGVGDWVTFLPGYRLEELPSMLAAHDVYTSSAPMDGTSSSLLEAMSTGTFPVVADCAANRPWVRHGENGYLFRPGDPTSLADWLAQAVSHPELREAASMRSRRLVVERGDRKLGMEQLLVMLQKCAES